MTNSDTRIRYLLGLASAAEREQLEAEYFEDDDAFQEMLAAEDDLFDAYARGELTGDERWKFEKRFASSLPGSDRVQFARAWARIVPVVQPLETNPSRIVFFPKLQSTAVFAAVMLFVTLLAWLIIERKRMTNELGQLRSQYVELSKRTEELRVSNDSERRDTAAMRAQHVDFQGQGDKPRRRTNGTKTSQRTHRLPEVKIDQGQIVSKPKSEERWVEDLDTSYIDPVETTVISHEPNATDASLPPASTSSPTGFRSDPRNTALSGVEVDKPLYTYFLLPREHLSGKSTIRISTAQSLVRFRVRLEKATGHKMYQFTIENEDGQPVSVGLSDLLAPGETTINTHILPTPPSGTYILFLSGEESDGSFTKIAEYSFRIIIL